LKGRFGRLSHFGEWLVLTITADSYGHTSEFRERLMVGDSMNF
jgi:hypothetical protein